MVDMNSEQMLLESNQARVLAGVWEIIKQYRKLNEKVLNCAAEKIINQ